MLELELLELELLELEPGKNFRECLKMFENV